MKKRTVALLCAAVMLLGVIFGGTMALLSHSSKPLTNTFTAAEINLTLEETTGKNYIMAPGAVLDKDPTITMDKDSASCFVFVKVEERNNDVKADMTKKPVTWTMAEGWTPVYQDGDEDSPRGYTVYWREYQKSANEADRSFSVLAEDQVTISDELTKAYMKSKDAKPELIFTAYAIQMPNLAYLTDAGNVDRAVTDADGSLIGQMNMADVWALAQTQTTSNGAVSQTGPGTNA